MLARRWSWSLLVWTVVALPGFVHGALPELGMEPDELLRARADAFLLEALRAGEIDTWIVLTREGHPDPISADLGFFIGRAALIFRDAGERAERVALVSALDQVALEQSGIYDRTVPVARDASFEDELKRLLDELWNERAPRRVGVNMSPSSGLADGLSATSLALLERALGPERARRLVSAERTVMSFRSKKLPVEVDLYRALTAATHEIIEAALTDGFIRPGETTEEALRDHVQALAAERGFDRLAWERDACPGIYAGLFRKVSHAAPGADVIRPGEILWIDFGVEHAGSTTDMIRAAYVLRPGEREAPAEVARMFATVIRANRAAVAAMRPGVLGHEVDAAARSTVEAAGYPGYAHAAGHPVGRAVHDAGPSLGPRGPKYGAATLLPLEAGQIFAIEPSVMLPRPQEGGSWIINVEEEVLVTPEGATYLAPPQEELYLIAAPGGAGGGEEERHEHPPP